MCEGSVDASESLMEIELQEDSQERDSGLDGVSSPSRLMPSSGTTEPFLDADAHAPMGFFQ